MEGLKKVKSRTGNLKGGYKWSRILIGVLPSFQPHRWWKVYERRTQTLDSKTPTSRTEILIGVSQFWNPISLPDAATLRNWKHERRIWNEDANDLDFVLMISSVSSERFSQSQGRKENMNGQFQNTKSNELGFLWMFSSLLKSTDEVWTVGEVKTWTGNLKGGYECSRIQSL